jgi:hypothetical protein
MEKGKGKPSKKGERIIKQIDEISRSIMLPPPLAEGNLLTENPITGVNAHYLRMDGEKEILTDKMRVFNNYAGSPWEITEKEAKDWIDKEEQIREMDYDKWFQQSFKFGPESPINQKWSQEINPEYWKKKDDFIKARAEINADMAKIKLYGVRNERQAILNYYMDTHGMIAPESVTHLLFDNQQWRGPKDLDLSDQKTYYGGLFSFDINSNEKRDAKRRFRSHSYYNKLFNQ